MLRSFEGTPFAEQEAELRRLLGTLPVARLSIDRSGIGMNLARTCRATSPQVVGESFTNESKARWAADFKILLQRREPQGQGQLRIRPHKRALAEAT